MPKRSVDIKEIQNKLLAYLRRRGAVSAKVLGAELQVSQPTISRILKLHESKIISYRKFKEVLYALIKEKSVIESAISIYEIHGESSAKKLGSLTAIEPAGYIFTDSIGKSTYFPDLPYFLADLRPTGFLGRLIPQRHPELKLPDDIKYWTSEHCLIYLTKEGWNNPGNIIIGEEAFNLYLTHLHGKEAFIYLADKPNKYEEYALNILSHGVPGSSAGGEQPKFLAWLEPSKKEVLVKFSPILQNSISERVADLLICEHLALNILNKYKIKAAKSDILYGKKRVFLEVERFDRLANNGRKGVVSLNAFNSEFVGEIGVSWTIVAKQLAMQKIISAELVSQIKKAETFGSLIANSDMHLFNLSFIVTQGINIQELAPIYDMSPMLFMPHNNQILAKEFKPELPSPENAAIWLEILPVAQEYWAQVLQEKRISKSFKIIAKQCLDELNKQQKLGRFLPI